ncbi:MAG: hypothetical protein H7Y03_06730 [Chitinophagaceae bacterium]|nr:hypothetical protein [Chitinophagaceae bacterium]
MKYLFTSFMLLLFIFVKAQVIVTVNAGSVMKTLTGKENGVNLDYLMDGTFIAPNTPTTTATALKSINAKILRYPGGEKSDNYLFSAAPWTSSSPRMSLKDPVAHWPTGDNQFVDVASADKLCRDVVLDFDEFMSMCTTVGASPLIVVAYDAIYSTASAIKPTKAELITHAAEWVRYANITKGYNVKYWMLGNESWNLPDYNGTTTPAQYALDVVDFASAMKAIDPSIKIVVNGRAGWWQTLLQSPALPYIDILGFSNYPIWQYTGGYEYYRTNNVDLVPETQAAINDINNYAPVGDRARLMVMPTEYNSIDWSGYWPNDNNVGHALCNFQMFGDLIVKPKVESACMWNTRWVDNLTVNQSIYDALDKDGNLNANGTVMGVWGSALEKTMISAVSGNNFVRSYASYDAVTQKLNIILLNKDNTPKTINLAISNYVSSYNGAKWQFSGTGVADQFPTYSMVDTIMNAASLSGLVIPANSVTILKLHEPTLLLPLIFKSFTASKIPEGVALNWRATELPQFSHYEIEKSVDGISFATLRKISRSNNSSGTYSFIDGGYNAGEPVYYRLKLVDVDAVNTYSEIVYVEPQATKLKFAVVVSPNPVSTNVAFKITSPASTSAVITITDRTGLVLLKMNARLTAGSNNLSLPATLTLSGGIYILHVAAEKMEGSATFIK